MAPFRPTYLNKRYYPGNASVIGPTTQATLGITTTTCCSCISTVCGTASEVFTLGCRCTTCSCSYCHCCCCCNCIVCTKNIPGGRWSKWEQYEASSRSSWGDTTCSTGPQIGFCSSCCGSCTSTGNDCKGFLIQDGSPRYWVPPACAEVVSNWHNRGNAVSQACTCMGNCAWFVPDCGTLQMGYGARSYWDSYTSSTYWSNTSAYDNASWAVRFTTGVTYVRNNQGASMQVRAMRTT